MIAPGEPRAAEGRAPDVFSRDGWVPMRQFRDEDEVDFAIVGTGAGGGVMAARLAEAGFSVVALRSSGRWPISPRTSASRTSSTGPTTGSARGTNRSSSAPTIPAGRSAGRRCISRWWRCGFAPTGSAPARAWATAGTGRWTRTRCGAPTGGSSVISASPGPCVTPGGPAGAAIPTARTRSTPPAWCLRAAPRRLASAGRPVLWRRSRRRAARRHPVSTGGSARSAARPMPSRACSTPTSPARFTPVPRSAIWRWSDASRPMPPVAPPACTITAAARGGSRRRVP